MAFPYQPTDQEQMLLDAYERGLRDAPIGFDGIAPRHLEALNAVAAAAVDAARMQASQPVPAPVIATDAALAGIADTAALLLCMVEVALKVQRPLGPMVPETAAKLRAQLQTAGWTEKAHFGNLQRPGAPIKP